MRYIDSVGNIVDYGNTVLSADAAAALGLTPVSDDYVPPTKYIYSNYGMTCVKTTEPHTATTGEVVFTSEPTTAQLGSAFPSIAGSRVYTLTTNPVAGDTITICGIVLTAGTNFSIGSDCDVTAANLNTALNSNKEFSAIYGGISGNNTITITEKIPGNQNNPTTASYTGTMVVSSGTLTSSVWGYKTAYINQQLTALMAAYIPKMEQIIRANSIAVLRGTSTATHTTAFADLDSWLSTEREAIING